jgi:hypothetical protein
MQGGGECCWGGKAVIHRSAGGSTTSHRSASNGKSTMKGDGDGEAWIRSYNEKKMCNHG